MGKVGFEDVEWTELAQDREQTPSILDRTINVLASKVAASFLTS